MKRRIHAAAALTIAAAALSAQPILAQETAAQPDRITVPFSDPARPKTVKIHLLHGNVTVRGYEGNQVIIDGTPSSRRGRREEAPPGMRRIPMNSSGLEAEEENNVVRIGASAMSDYVDLNVQVPRATALQVKLTNSRELIIENVEGEIEAHNTNGKVTLNNVAGSVVAHSLNGGIVVNLVRVQNDKPMSFSTLNGNIDVTLPADIKARLKFKSQNGDVFTDFDLKTEAPVKPTVEESRSEGRGRYRISVDRSVYGTVNGGGPEISFTTMNGRIFVRKK